MGGDFYSIPNLQGAYWAVKRSLAQGKNLKVYVVGPEDKVLGRLREAAQDPEVHPDFRIDLSEFQTYLKRGNIEAVHATQVVEMTDHPGAVIRTKKDSSLGRGYQLVKEGKADALVSAGNSGAVMAFGISTLGRLAEVRRPAILCTFPSRTGFTVILDAGANVDCTSEHLAQFATMGIIYSQVVFSKSQPKVALMNIGEEEGKGNELVKATYEFLKGKIPDQLIDQLSGESLRAYRPPKPSGGFVYIMKNSKSKLVADK